MRSPVGDELSAHALCDTVNRLITACEEDVLVERDAVQSVRQGALADHLRDLAAQRAIFIEDLRQTVVSLGGRPAHEANARAWARSIGRHLRAFVGGWHEGDLFAALVRAEERTVRTYDRALGRWLPHALRREVKRQREQLRGDLDEARAQRGQH